MRHLAFPFHYHRKATIEPACRKDDCVPSPTQGADAIPDQSIQNAPRLLGIHQVHVDGSRISESLLDGMLRDLMKTTRLEDF